MTTATLQRPPVTETATIAPVDVAQLATQAAAALADLARAHRITISCHHVGQCTATTDAAALRAVVQELLAEAVTASEFEEYVLVRTTGQHQTVHIDIVTFGAGSRFIASRILEAYLPSLPGAPLTSATALRRQLEALGCRLSTSTDVGRNTTFTVIVPRRRLTGGHPVE